MRSRAITLAILLAAFSTSASAGVEARPAGRYCGELMSSGQIVTAETTFQIEPDGRISGTYEFRDGDAVTDGRLQEIETDSGLTKSLRWTDKYGNGRLVITFDPAFGRFEGHWGAADAVPNQVWSGRRCQEPST